MTIIIPQLQHIAPPTLADEVDRLEDLYSMRILDSAADERFDQFARLAATVLDTPLAAISFVDKDRQWFKSAHGFSLSETPRDISFCGHAIAEDEILVVPDARSDRRFAANPMVTGEPGFRFYAGAVVRGFNGKPVGTCCVLDMKPRTLSEVQCSALIQIARVIEKELLLSHELSELRKEMKSVALVDHSTGLPNLVSFMSHLQHSLPHIRKSHDSVLLALIRIERLDALEAALGRDALAYIIVQVADRISACLGDNCHVASTGEDKIGALIPIAGRPASKVILTNLIKSLDMPFYLGDHTVRLRTSIGASICPDDADDGQLLLKRARTALWSLPLSASSGYQFYKRVHSNTASRQFQIEAAMRSGLEKNEFSLVFQPIINVANNAPAAAEALLRWHSESFGPISPIEFIPIAEASGFILDLGNWVLDSVCAQIEKWRKLHLGIPAISVNITSHQLHQARFAHQLQKRIDRHNLAPSWLSLELTESAIVVDVPSAVNTMNSLREIGIGIAIDDFGTGFSSLSYLQRLPIDTLKIDRSFISRVPQHEDDKKLIRSIVSIGKELDLIVIAEGVENTGQLEFLKKIECDQIQGFLFSKPLPAAEFVKYSTGSRHRLDSDRFLAKRLSA